MFYNGIKIASLLLSLTLWQGCLQKQKVIYNPEASYLITDLDIFGNPTIAVYDAKTNQMTEVGRVKRSNLIGRTISSFDWGTYIKEQEKCER